jgi:hypothetical protein
MSEKVPNNVVDINLYINTRNKIKKSVKVWPSAYASGLLVKEYKRLGGRYKGQKTNDGLDRWYKEKWVNVCKQNMPPCGRTQSSLKNYPYCRPSIRVNINTPMTVSELVKKYGSKKLQELCKKKRTTALPKDNKAKRIHPRETRK